MKGILIMYPDGVDVNELYDRMELKMKYFAMHVGTLHVQDEDSMSFVQNIRDMANKYETKKDRGFPRPNRSKQ